MGWGWGWGGDKKRRSGRGWGRRGEALKQVQRRSVKERHRMRGKYIREEIDKEKDRQTNR